MTTIPLRLTQAQRKLAADLIPSLAARLVLDSKGQRTIRLDESEIVTIQKSATEAVPNADNGRVRNSLHRIIEATNLAMEHGRGMGGIPKADRLLQFRISLKDIKPEIWRRIQVRDCTLDRLHELIQMSMGWTNSHLHCFEIDGQRYGDPLLLDDGFDDFDCIDSTETKLSSIVPRDGKRYRFLYEYDFGDDWRHEVLFEGFLTATKGQRYPLCLEGERACPPEDVGGVWGYQEYLQALVDPDHERHEEFLEWRGTFEPEAFSAEQVTKLIRRGLPNWREV